MAQWAPHAVVLRWHRQLEALTEDPLPDEATEAADWDGADVFYDIAIGVLRERTRNPGTFPLVAAENAGYGFRAIRSAYADLGAR